MSKQDQGGASRVPISQRKKRFAELWVEYGNDARAHKDAGFMPHANDVTHRKKGCQMRKHPQVAAYIKELQAEHAEANKVRVEDLLKQLDAAYVLAMREKRPSAMVSAVMGKARITGHDKQIVEHHMTRPIDLVINRPGSGD